MEMEIDSNSYDNEMIEFINDYGLPRNGDYFDYGDSWFSVYAIYIEFVNYNSDTHKIEENKHIRICFADVDD